MIVNEYPFAYLIGDTQPQTIATALNKLLTDHVLYQRIEANALAARSVLHWGEEEKKLLHFWKDIL